MTTNPVPGLRDDFVTREVRGGWLQVKPCLPRPNELAIFSAYAREAGFRPATDVHWGGGHWAPKHWFRRSRTNRAEREGS